MYDHGVWLSLFFTVYPFFLQLSLLFILCYFLCYCLCSFFGISHLILVLVSHVSLLSGDLSPPVFPSLMAGSILSLCEHSSIFLVFLMIYSTQSL